MDVKASVNRGNLIGAKVSSKDIELIPASTLREAIGLGLVKGKTASKSLAE